LLWLYGLWMTGYLYQYAVIRRKMPVIIYQMGKVGSSSLRKSFPAGAYKLALHVHHLQPDRIQRRKTQLIAQGQRPARHFYVAESVQRVLIAPQRRACFLTPVRDPVSRNLSAFFQAYERHTGERYTDSELDVATLREIFLRDYPHDRALTWFDDEFRQTLDVDVYSQPFPAETGYIEFDTHCGRVLVFRLELDDTTKERLIAQFLDVPAFRLKQANRASKKAYAAQYRRFKETMTLPDSYLDEMLNSRYARHFYTPAERDAIRRRWSG
jgi:transposase